MSETQQPHPYGSPCTHLCTTDGEQHRHVTYVRFPQPPAIEPKIDASISAKLLEMFKSLRGELRAVNGDCSDPSWKDRNLHAPNCWCVWIGEIDTMLQRASEDEKP